jgi:5-formyltetrahydrofolate cyclo-ligase
MTGMEKQTRMDKETARAFFRARRRERTEEDQIRAGNRLAELVLDGLGQLKVHPGTTIPAYLSVGSEPSTRTLLPTLEDSGYNVVVPICEPDYRLSWARWFTGVELARSPRAWVDEPVGERFGLQIMTGLPLILVPGLAVDSNGNRMGQGGGYYDRFLASLPPGQDRPQVVGLFYSDEVVPAGTFESTALDAPLDGIVTPDGWVWFSDRTV